MNTSVRRRVDAAARLTRLRIIARTAALASAEAPALPKALGVPAHSVGNRVLISAARSMVTTATRHRELLTRYGLSGSLLAEVTETVDRFQGEAGRAVDALHAKNEGRGRLKAVMSELSGLTRLLDAINQVRLGGDAGLLTVWNRARNVVGPPAPARKPVQGVPPGGEVAS